MFSSGEEEFQQIIRRERRITLQLAGGKLPSGALLPAHSKPRRNQPVVFEAGEKISGLVRLELDGGAPTAKVRVALVCLTQVRLALQPKRKSIVSNLFSFDEGDSKESQIFFDRQSVLQMDLLDEDQKLTSGKHELPFTFNLPAKGLPSTLSSFYGFIKYTVEIFTIDDDQYESRGEREIILMAPIDADLEMPVSKATEKSLNGGRIVLSGLLEQKGFYPGSAIPVVVGIDNQTTDTAVQAQVSLYQIQIFECNQVHRILERCLTVEPIGGSLVDGGQSLTETIHLPLSANLVLSLQSQLITVKYYVLVALDIPSTKNNTEEMFQVKLPFVMSTKAATGKPAVHRKANSQHSPTEVKINVIRSAT